MDWIGLDWIGLDWIGLDWIGLDWIGLDWIGLDWIGLDWIGLDWIGLDWIGLDWIGLDWIGWIGKVISYRVFYVPLFDCSAVYLVKHKKLKRRFAMKKVNKQNMIRKKQVCPCPLVLRVSNHVLSVLFTGLGGSGVYRKRHSYICG